MKTPHLRALDLADSGDWDSAHRIVQKLDDSLACWIHANLHREEGDRSNADYWYQRARRRRPATDLLSEREQIRQAVAEQEASS